MREALLVLAAFLVMEPLTTLAHRYIFHGFGFAIHRSHHAERTGIFETNDFYPLISALITMTIIAAGVFYRPVEFLIPVGFGMTVYGLLYFFIHDLVIHHRIEVLKRLQPLFRWHTKWHRLHHRFGREPYGLLLPLVLRRGEIHSPSHSVNMP